MMLIAFTGKTLRGSVDPADHPFYRRDCKTRRQLSSGMTGLGGHRYLTLERRCDELVLDCLGDYAGNNYYKVDGRTVICDAMDGRGDWWNANRFHARLVRPMLWRTYARRCLGTCLPDGYRYWLCC